MNFKQILTLNFVVDLTLPRIINCTGNRKCTIFGQSGWANLTLPESYFSVKIQFGFGEVSLNGVFSET